MGQHYRVASICNDLAFVVHYIAMVARFVRFASLRDDYKCTTTGPFSSQAQPIGTWSGACLLGR